MTDPADDGQPVREGRAASPEAEGEVGSEVGNEVGVQAGTEADTGTGGAAGTSDAAGDETGAGSGQEWPLISLVVPTIDDSVYVGGFLRSVNRLDYPRDRLEVILVGDRQNDHLEQFKNRFPEMDLAVLYYPLRPGRKRNIGIDRARGEYIAFADDDCIVREDWLKTGVTHLRENQAFVGVGGPNFTPPNEPPFARAVGRIFGSRFLFSFRYTAGGTRAHEIDHNPTCNYLLQKDVAQKIQFHNTLFPGEDVEFDIRLKKEGYRLLYAPNMVVWHHRRMGPCAFARQMYSYGKTRANVVRMHPQQAQLRHFAFFIAFFFMAGLWLAGFMGVNWPGNVDQIPFNESIPGWIKELGPVWVPLSLTLFYFLVIALAGLLVGYKDRSVKTLVYTPVVLVIQHFVYSVGLLVGLVRKV